LPPHQPQILDDLYWENFKAAKEEEARQHAVSANSTS
jgi:hypothetical protein